MGGAGTGTVGATMASTFLESRVEFGEQSLSHVKPSQIAHGRNLRAGIDSLAHFFAIFGGARRKISGRFVDVAALRRAKCRWPRRAILSSAEGKLRARPRRAFPYRARRLRLRGALLASSFLPIMFARTAQAKFAERLAQSAAEIFHAASSKKSGPADRARRSGRAGWPHPRRCERAGRHDRTTAKAAWCQKR